MSTAPDRARILLVDDSMLMRKAASKMLSEEFDVETAVDGEDAWAKIQADTTIQVVFTDLSMPKLDGYGLVKLVRGAEDEGTLNLPVIVVTGADNDDVARKKALDLGATDFITKPFSSIDLLARARAHANYRRIARKLEQQITLDALTGLVNKAGFLDRLQQDIAFVRRMAQPLTVVRIEIDDFRNVFLTYGKQRAEALVKHVAQHLHERVRKEDSAARAGLSGFALALPGGAHAGSRTLIDRIVAELAATPFEADGAAMPFTLSAAVCSPALEPEPTAIDLLDACEALLQNALKAGGNRVLGDAVEVPDVVDALDLAAPPAKPGKPAPVTSPPPATAPAAPAPTVKPSPKPEPVAAKAPVPEPAATTASAAPVSVDDAITQIERGDAQSVLPRLPQLIQRLLPLFRALSARQRGQLVAFLQKLGV